MGKFCRTHVRLRTDQELKDRFKQIKLRAAKGEKLGPGIRAEIENITREFANRKIAEGADPGMNWLPKEA